jgi:hypothetical protein
MNQIDNAPLSSRIDITNDKGDVIGKVELLRSAFSRWFSQITTALLRPTVTQSISFPLTGAQNSSDVAIAFPAGTVALTDIPAMQAPAPPRNTCFTCHIAAVDQVVVRFNNYSNAAVSFASANFSITVLKQ